MTRKASANLRRILTKGPAALRLAPWTIALATTITLLNVGLFDGAPIAARRLLDVLQLERAAMADGELWRLLTANLVHWSPAHFALDIGAFLVVGLLFERSLGRAYPWMLLASAVAVGVAVSTLRPELAFYRGLSGVCSGQFAVAVAIRLFRADSPAQFGCTLAAAVIFAAKLATETVSGELAFATERLGDLGDPVPIAHLAGTAAALLAGIALLAFRPARDTMGALFRRAANRNADERRPTPDEGHHPRGGIRIPPPSADARCEQATHADLRQADDLSPALGAHARGNP